MPPLSFDIFGNGPESYVRELEGLIQTLGLKEIVKIMGKLEPQQLMAKYNNYHAFLFTSRWEEPFGLTILEAMAQGVPVIATNRGAAPEIICDGENGILVPADDPVALANAINGFIKTPFLAEKIRYNALQTIHKEYTFEKLFNKTEEYFRMELY